MTNETIIQFTTGQLSVAVISMLIGFTLVQFLLATWIRSRIENSVKHEYDKNLENYKSSELQRQKAAMVAQLFAKWIKYGKDSEYKLNGEQLLDRYEELNKMSMEISLWIKDERLLEEIMKAFHWDDGAQDIRSLTGEVRKLILNDKKDSFNPQNIVLWTMKDKGTPTKKSKD